MKAPTMAVMLLMTLTGAAPCARGEAFTFTTFDVPATLLSGINDSGQIVGFYADGGGATHNFLRTGSNITTFDFPGAVSTSAIGISATGQLVGSIKTRAGSITAFFCPAQRSRTSMFRAPVSHSRSP